MTAASRGLSQPQESSEAAASLEMSLRESGGCTWCLQWADCQLFLKEGNNCQRAWFGQGPPSSLSSTLSLLHKTKM